MRKFSMKRFAAVMIAMILMVSCSMNVFAACSWDTDNYGIKAVWDQLNSKGTLYLYKGTSYKVGNKIITAQDRTSYDFTERIQNMGPGTYHFTITDTSGRTWESDNIQVTEDMVESMGQLTWSKENGEWKLRNFKGELVKGWQQVGDCWYYLDENTGKCYTDRYTPDGYYVGPDGAWDGQSAVSTTQM